MQTVTVFHDDWPKRFDAIVIGKGLIGVAAWCHMSESTPNVAVIGPDEPNSYASHEGVFASHYDEGRLIGRLGRDRTWAELITRAIEHCKAVQECTGVAFYEPCGRLTVAREEQLQAELNQHEQVTEELGIAYDWIGEMALPLRFPMFTFPTGYSATFEGTPAGLLRPRALINAQLAVGTKNRGIVIREEVHAVELHADRVTVTTQSGQRYETERVLLATGAFANCYDLLKRKLAVRVKSEITVLVEVPGNEIARLRNMPTLVYAVESPVLDGIYMTPPLQYPDGRYYLKIGCDTATDRPLGDLVAMQEWMRQRLQDEMPMAVLQGLLNFMPKLKVVSWLSRPCLVAYTPHGKPFIDQLAERVFVATGGNGRAAQCSRTLGELAAHLVLGKAWPAPFARPEFRVRYADEIGIADGRYERLGM